MIARSLAASQAALRSIHRPSRRDVFEAPEPARVRGASVTFEPGARTAWHTHPLGQVLIVTSGLGWAQRWGARVNELMRCVRQNDNTAAGWRVELK